MVRPQLCPNLDCRGRLPEVWVWGDAYCPKCGKIYIHAFEFDSSQEELDKAYAEGKL